jgi:hypothetical protein
MSKSDRVFTLERLEQGRRHIDLAFACFKDPIQPYAERFEEWRELYETTLLRFAELDQCLSFFESEIRG